MQQKCDSVSAAGSDVFKEEDATVTWQGSEVL